MDVSNLAIETIGYIAAPEVWTSARIEAELAPVYQRLRLPEGRLELMTGITERRFYAADARPSDCAAQAGEQVLARSRFKREDIDLLIFCGVCRDRLEPATASYVHHLLGLSRRCLSFDISNACLGFVNALGLAAGLIRSGQARRALIVSGENGKPLLERTLRLLLEDTSLTRQSIKPYFANLTIGGGAAAAVVCAREEAPYAPHLGVAVSGMDSAASALCQGDSMGAELDMQTDSEALLLAGVALAQKTWADFRVAGGCATGEPDRVICHQVGKRHQSALLEALGIDVAKDYSSFATFGNIGSVSVPLTLARAIDSGAFVAGQTAALLGIGSGLACMMASVHYPEQGG